MPRKFSRTYALREGEALSDAVLAGLREQSRLFGGGDVVVTLERPRRSNKQNAYLWAVVYRTIREALMDAGHVVPAEALHELMKSRYLEPRVIDALGETLVLPGSSAKLDSTAFHEFVESVKADEAVLALCIDWEAVERERGTYERPAPPAKREVELPPLSDFRSDEPDRLTLDEISDLF